jgi:hypothetical protein
MLQTLDFVLNLFLATSPISFLLCLSNFIMYSVSLAAYSLPLSMCLPSLAG